MTHAAGEAGRSESAIDLTYANRLFGRTQKSRGRLVLMHATTSHEEPDYDARGVTPRTVLRPGVSRARVLSASVGGAAAAPIDPEVRIAPLRDSSHIAAAELRATWAHAEPWDPWPAQRVGYDSPAPASLFLPAQKRLDGLVSYLNRSLR